MRLSYGDPDTQDVADAFNEGIFLGSYFGHATATGGWGSPVFGYGDIDNLTNAQLYPFLVNFSCSSAGIHYVGSLGCNEKWMTVANKGARPPTARRAARAVRLVHLGQPVQVPVPGSVQ